VSSLYDLFGVAPTATAEEIRTAWRNTIADLDPTDRRFGLLNDAAGVLLDADKRAAYDESLAPPEPSTGQVDQSTEPSTEPIPAPYVEPTSWPADLPAPTPWPAMIPQVVAPRSSVPTWLLAALGALAVIVAIGALALAALVPSGDRLADATSEAEQAAQRAATTIFSYDYTRLDADQAAADGYLTAAYRQKYDELFGLIKQNAPGIKLKVEAQFIASGVVRTGSGSDGWLSGLTEGKADRVQVLLFFDQEKTSAESTTPVTFRNFATLTMQRVGDSWLVDGIAGPPVQD